ncbi:phosphoadenosine phosphosulfate reductase family protein [Massilia sp. METH4]|uniref:phosphoadenosine phosphosulfate reductase family protein n=1 Tax=Massilia sp. METH4 TaxID=3123041 RepID=UPI0030CFAA23
MIDPFIITDRTAISLSGGRTSAYMLHRVLEANGGLPDDVIVMFANTGKEDEATLRFVRDIGQHWHVPITWVEYRADAPGYALVDFDMASRNGEPFEALIGKRQYLPNPVTRFCTVELKIRAMHKHLTALGWKADGEGWDQMVGIRADEPRRVAKIRARPSPETVHETMVMPLNSAGVTKADVGAFWRAQPFDLELPNHNGVTYEGNCDLCFLKGRNIVQTLIVKKPGRAIWWAAQEGRSLNSKESGARFRNDRPSYQTMLERADRQQELFPGADLDADETIDCLCGDDA